VPGVIGEKKDIETWISLTFKVSVAGRITTHLHNSVSPARWDLMLQVGF